MIANAEPSRSRRLERLDQLFVKARAVRKLGDDVEVGKSVHLLDRARALGRILDRSHQTENASAGTEQRFAKQVHVTRLAVLVREAHLEPLRRIATRQLDEPAPECAPILA